MKIGKVETLPPDKPAEVTLEKQKDGKYVLNFKIPAGKPGKDGKNGKDGKQGPAGPAGPPGPPGTVDPAEITRALQPALEQIARNRQDIDELNQRLDDATSQILDEIRSLKEELAKKPSDGGDTSSGEVPANSDVILYYTSSSCTACKEVDDMVAEMKRKGWPIVVTRLSARDASVQGVPRIYVPAKKKHVRGIRNCASYLASLVR